MVLRVQKSVIPKFVFKHFLTPFSGLKRLEKSQQMRLDIYWNPKVILHFSASSRSIPPVLSSYKKTTWARWKMLTKTVSLTEQYNASTTT